MLARGPGHLASFILSLSLPTMEKANMKTATAVVIVLIIVLLFSWQYIGQEEKESPLEGDWTLAGYKAFAITGSVAADASAEESLTAHVSVDGDVVTYVDDEDTIKFYLVSDHQAVSVDYGYNVQMYLHGETLYMIAFYQAEVAGISALSVVVTAFSEDGSYDIDDDPFEFDGTMQSVVADVYNGNNAVLESKILTFAVNEEGFRAAYLTVDLEDTATEALGFVMGDPDAYTIFCMTVDGTVFNLTVEEGVITTVTGAAGSFDAVQYYVYDRDGYLADDIYGLGSDSVIYRTNGYAIPVNGYYEDGRLCEKRTDGSSSLFAVTSQCTDGYGFALVAGGSIVVNADGKLWLINCEQIPVPSS